jgi:hypothetical protein
VIGLAHLRAALAVLTILTLALVTGTTVEAQGNDVGRGLCIATAQGVTKIKGTSCKQAKKVLRLYYRADLPKRPECRGQGSISFRGGVSLGSGSPGRFLNVVLPRDALGAAMQQLARVLGSEDQMLICPGCDRLFIPSDKRQTYHSKACANRARARRNYKKKTGQG